MKQITTVFEELDKDISLIEIENGINKLKRSTADGPEVLINEYFIECKDYVLPILYTMVICILFVGYTPKGWSSAAIVLFFEKEGNVIFNDALNTFYLRLYGVGHMVKCTQIVREETRCRHMGYCFRLTARVRLYAPSHRQDITYHGLCYTSREIVQWVHHMKDRSDDPSHYERTLLPCFF